jgi:Lipopolysaccharide export system permease LptF/LptG
MNRPGDRLRALAARVCTVDAMARLIDPVIADMQAEHTDAIRHGRVWRSRWVRVAGYLAFAKVVLMCDRSAADDAGLLVPAAGWSTGAAALATGIFVAIPIYSQRAYLEPGDWQAVMFLLPQALAMSVPIGATIGIAMGLPRQRLSVHVITLMLALAFLCSAGSLVNLGWLVPNANQAFRVAVFRRVAPGQPSPAKGDPELTFAELSRLIQRKSEFPVGSAEWDDTTRLRTGYHMRLALAFATFALSLFAMSLLALCRRRGVIVIGAVGAILGYYALLFYGRSFALEHQLSPPVAAWLPNVAFALLSVALTLSARPRHSAGATAQS